MSAHSSKSPAHLDPTHHAAARGIAGNDGSGNLMALADAIEACLQINEMPEDPVKDERTVLLPSTVAEITALTSMPGAKPAVAVKALESRQLMTQPLAVQPKPTAIFASRLPQPEGGPRPAHFVAAPGIDLPQRAQIAAVKITTPAATAVALAPAEAPRKQTLFVQPAKKRSKAPWIAAVALLVAAVGVGGFMERGKLQQLRAGMAAKSAPVTQPAAQPVAQPVAQPQVVAAPVVAVPVATPVVAAAPVPSAAEAAPAPAAQPEPVADATDRATARAKHRETHRQAKAETKPATERAPAAAPQADTKPDTKAEAKADAPVKQKNATDDELKKASEALLKAQLDSAI